MDLERKVYPPSSLMHTYLVSYRDKDRPDQLSLDVSVRAVGVYHALDVFWSVVERTFLDTEITGIALCEE